MYSHCVDFSGWGCLIGFALAATGLILSAVWPKAGALVVVPGIVTVLAAMGTMKLLGVLRRRISSDEIAPLAIFCVVVVIALIGAARGKATPTEGADAFADPSLKGRLTRAGVGVGFLWILSPSVLGTLRNRAELREFAPSGVAAVDIGPRHIRHC